MIMTEKKTNLLILGHYYHITFFLVLITPSVPHNNYRTVFLIGLNMCWWYDLFWCYKFQWCSLTILDSREQTEVQNIPFDAATIRGHWYCQKSTYKTTVNPFLYKSKIIYHNTKQFNPNWLWLMVYDTKACFCYLCAYEHQNKAFGIFISVSSWLFRYITCIIKH